MRMYAGIPLILVISVLATLLYISSSRNPSGTPSAGNPPGHSPPTEQAVAGEQRDDALDRIRKMARPAPVAVNPKAAQIFSAWRTDAPEISIAEVKKWIAAPVGSSHKLRFGGMELAAVLDSLLAQDGVTAFGFDIAEPAGRFQGTFLPSGKLRAEFFIEGQAIAFAVNSQPGDDRWALAETVVSALLCVPPGTVYTKAEKADPTQPQPANENLPQSAPPILNSLPGAAYVLYCDFDGEAVTHPKWNGGATINAAPHPNANDATFVSNVWKRVSEDYAPFAINVTTDRGVFNATPTVRRVHCIITPTDTALPGSGGVAYLNSFGDGTPCWTFNQSEYACADTISHEVGHTLGLQHDGRNINGDAYYGGHGSGAVSWAPIMGAPWSDESAPFEQEDVTQWSRGEYANANNLQDDLAIIAGTSNGFGYRADDIGSTQATASPLKFTGSAVSDAGIIERSTDSDWFSFTTSGGSVTLNVNTVNINSTQTPEPGANLAVALQLLNSSGTVLQTVDPASTLSASIAANLAAGSYFLKINGAARGTASTGFTTYASLGQYTVTGNVPRTGVSILAVTPTSRTVPAQGGAFEFSVTSDTSWSWGKDSAWVTSSEATPQTGSQTFSYTIGANPGSTPRTASITLTAGGLSVTHQINQQGSIIDDHGGSTANATLVAANSSTAGNIETAGDEDFFRIEIASTGTLMVETSGSTDTYGYLLASNGSPLAENDDSVGSNFRISQAVTAGTYYVRVRHYNAASVGIYQLISTFTASPQLSISPPTTSAAAAGGAYSFNVASNALWTWSDNASWIESSEVSGQSGGQLFEFAVAPNPSASSRSATITLVTGGLTATHTVTQAGVSSDDHGNNRAAATLVAQSSTTGGNLETAGDLDYFRINVTSGGTLTLATTGTTDTYGTLFDSAGNLLLENDDSDGRNFRLAWPVTAGTYYVEVRHYSSSGTGSYQLVSGLDSTPVLSLSLSEASFGAAAASDSINITSNATWSWTSSAAWLTSGETVSQSGNQTFSFNLATNTGAARSATITFTTAGLTPRTLTVNQAGASNDDHGDSIGSATPVAPESNTPGIINVNGDNDFFRIIITQPGVLSVYTTGNTDTFGHLLDSLGNELASNDDTSGGNFRINRTMAAGTYYVRVRGFSSSTGAYSLISIIGSELDDHGNVTATATLITENSTTPGNIEISGDNDYFRINLTIPGILTLYSTGSMDTFGHLLDSAGVELESNDDDGVVTNFLIQRNVAAGTYYVRVRGFSTTIGSYALVSEFLPADDHGNATSTATVIAENSTTNGNLGVAGDIDYFRINVTRTGTLTVSTTGATDTFGRLRSSAGSLLASNDDTVGTNFQISHAVTAGTYYVEVTHFSTTGTGAYQLVAALPGSPRQLYEQAVSAAGLTGAEAQANATPRGDGVKNILKYAFNMNLAASDMRVLLPGTGTAGLPSVVLEGAGPIRTLKVEYLRRKNSGLLYQPKWSSSLDPAGFVQMAGTTDVVDIDTGWERVILRQNFDPNLTPKAFATVEVVLP